VCEQCESGEEAAESHDELVEETARVRAASPTEATERAIRALNDDR